MIPLQEAIEIVEREIAAVCAVRAPQTETVALDEALGRVLAEPAHTDRPQPPFDRSTRDGFAVRSADCPDEAPVRLRCLGEVAAGQSFAETVAPGTCVEIMTGAPVPAGADAVVMIEDCEVEGDAITVRGGARAGQNIVPTGAEAAMGQQIFEAGARLGPAALGLLASVGCARVPVRAQTRVAILTTGDELVTVGERPGPSEIRNSNMHALCARVKQAGAQPVPLPIVRDDPDRLRDALLDAGASSELVIITGGVSKGKHDHVKTVLASLGARTAFAQVAIRPGKPVTFGVFDRAGNGNGDGNGNGNGKKGWAARRPLPPYFGLPGNPVSALVTFELLVRPALHALSGQPGACPGLRPARLARPHGQSPLRLHAFIPARYEGTSGDLIPLVSQGSGDMVCHAQAEALLSVPPGTTSIPAGAWVTCLPL